MFNSKLYAVWKEKTTESGSAYQNRVAEFDGTSTWTFRDGNGTTGLNKDATKDVDSAGFYKEPESIPLQPGQVLGQGQDGEIPQDLITVEDNGSFTKNYTYNTTTNLVRPRKRCMDKHENYATNGP